MASVERLLILQSRTGLGFSLKQVVLVNSPENEREQFGKCTHFPNCGKFIRRHWLVISLLITVI